MAGDLQFVWTTDKGARLTQPAHRVKEFPPEELVKSTVGLETPDEHEGETVTKVEMLDHGRLMAMRVLPPAFWVLNRQTKLYMKWSFVLDLGQVGGVHSA